MYPYNPNNMESDPSYRQAVHRVKAKVGFYQHLTSFLLVNGMLIGIYLLSSLAAGALYYPWFIWPLLGWGIGLAFHFMSVFVFGSVSSPYNRQKLIEAEMRKMGVPSNGMPIDYSRTNQNFTDKK